MEFVIRVGNKEIDGDQEIHREFGIGKGFAFDEKIYVI